MWWDFCVRCYSQVTKLLDDWLSSRHPIRMEHTIHCPPFTSYMYLLSSFGTWQLKVPSCPMFFDNRDPAFNGFMEPSLLHEFDLRRKVKHTELITVYKLWEHAVFFCNDLSFCRRGNEEHCNLKLSLLQISTAIHNQEQIWHSMKTVEINCTGEVANGKWHDAILAVHNGITSLFFLSFCMDPNPFLDCSCAQYICHTSIQVYQLCLTLASLLCWRQQCWKMAQQYTGDLQALVSWSLADT